MANLDPQVTSALLAAKRAQRGDGILLEPDFPYAKITFDAEHFGADKEVDTGEDEG